LPLIFFPHNEFRLHGQLEYFTNLGRPDLQPSHVRLPHAGYKDSNQNYHINANTPYSVEIPTSIVKKTFFSTRLIERVNEHFAL